MTYSCCTSIEKYKILEDAGYDRIILSCVDISEMDQETFDSTCKTLADGRLDCRALNSFCSPQLKLCGPEYNVDFVTAYSESLAKRAAKIGIQYIGVGSPKSRNIPQGFSRQTAMEQFKRSLAAICSACLPYGINILLEAVCDIECNFITTTNESVEVIESLDIDNLQLVFDTYHAFMMNEDANPLRTAIKHVKLVHMAQNIDNRRHYLRKEKVDEYRVYIDVLRENGFDGEVSVEAFFDDIHEQAHETLRIMKSICTTN